MDLYSHVTDEILFSAEVATTKELIQSAVSGGANLRHANLCGANLRGANLRHANLRHANLCGANLYGANLRGANLYGANLRGANPCGANLYGANLRNADLCGADLRRANLRGADMSGANLRDADLRGANLYGANAQINGHAVIQVNGLPYPILITDTHLRAGCQNHTFAEWRAMTPEQIAKMDGQKAIDFYPTLIGLIDLFCKDREAAQQGVE